MQNGSQEDQKIFEASIKALQSEIANVGVHLVIDAEARQAYSKQILTMASELRISANTGRITWSVAAAQAQDARNVIMDVIRSRSTPVGLAMACNGQQIL